MRRVCSQGLLNVVNLNPSRVPTRGVKLFIPGTQKFQTMNLEEEVGKILRKDFLALDTDRLSKSLPPAKVVRLARPMELVGVVTSIKAQKTIRVAVDRFRYEKKLKLIYRRTKQFLCHDECEY